MAMTTSLKRPNSGLCECGCGQATRLAPQSMTCLGWTKGQPVRFVLGHNRRIQVDPAPTRMCECGCGQPTRLAPQSNTRRGWTKGQPMRFVLGHGRRGRVDLARRYRGVTSPNSGLCACGCGEKTKLASRTDLRLGWVKCQPLKFVFGHTGRRHGDASGGRRTPEYRAWESMIRRCYSSPNHAAWKYYGGRGITVSAHWRGPLGYERFLFWMGRRPSPAHSLDRINNDGPYEPGNVRWATATEQASNRRNGNVA
jgi:hypothetical protein